MKYGLSENILSQTIKAISRFDEIDRAAIFGSRAMGNYKKGSDIDLVIWGDKVTYDTVTKLNFMLNENLPLPHFYDVICYDLTDNASLKRHIDEFGREIFSRINNEQ